MGVVLFEILYNRMPYASPIAIIKKERVKVLRRRIPEHIKSLVENCLQEVPGNRPTVKEILEWKELYLSYELIRCIQNINNKSTLAKKILDSDKNLKTRYKFS